MPACGRNNAQPQHPICPSAQFQHSVVAADQEICPRMDRQINELLVIRIGATQDAGELATHCFRIRQGGMMIEESKYMLS